MPGLSVQTAKFDNSKNPTVTIEMEGDTSPSQDSDGDAETELPDNDISTEHHLVSC